MIDGGNGHRCGIDASLQIIHAAQGHAAKLTGHGFRLGRIRVDHRDQFDAEPLLLKFVVDAGMVPAKSAYTDDCYADWTSVMQRDGFFISAIPG